MVVERGARHAGVDMPQRHPELKETRQIPTLLVLLNEVGHVASVRPVPPAVKPWTLRDGQHNSFPFVQPKHALLSIPEGDERVRTSKDGRNTGRREAILSLATDVRLDETRFADWPGEGLIERVRERADGLVPLETTEAAAVPATMRRFVRACDPGAGGDPRRLLREVIEKLANELRQSGATEVIDVSAALLVAGGGAFMFDAEGSWRSILDSQVVSRVSIQMRQHESIAAGARTGICGLTGESANLIGSTFPQPNLPLLGQTYLFSRNKDAPANDRYGRFSADSMPASQDIVIRLAAAAEALTSDERRNLTWRSIPGEAPKQSDLLLAFVENVADVEVARTFTEDDEFSAEAPAAAEVGERGSVAEFEKRTERLIATVRAKITGDLSQSRVRLVIFRKLDPANRKAIYNREITVTALADSAKDWIAGERNVPEWLTLPVLRKGERKPRATFPLHVAPLGVIAFSREMFVRGGTQRLDTIGWPAAEALGLFLDPSSDRNKLAKNRVIRFLRLVLNRRATLVSGAAHALRRGFESAKAFDRREVLRTISVLGILLHKLKPKEKYMNGTAFKLGQLLAAADVVHAGYCADVRKGDVPPSLLGNQVFSMAQTAPERALAMLCRRWKPYDGWAKKAARERTKSDALVASKRPEEHQRGWDIRTALRHAREMRPLAEELAPALASCGVTDAFRAELLLGYIAGLPKAQKDEMSATEQHSEVI
jgi:hypothetical protein